MSATTKLLVGAGLGAGLMYLFDPELGRRRRTVARDRAVRLAHKTRDAAEEVARDARNKARGLAAGDLSVLTGGKRVLSNPLRGHWSPSARALMGLLGGGMFLYGLKLHFPTACIMGTAGLALAAEGILNADVEEIKHLPQNVACAARNVAEKVGLGSAPHETRQRENNLQTAGTGI